VVQRDVDVVMENDGYEKSGTYSKVGTRGCLTAVNTYFSTHTIPNSRHVVVVAMLCRSKSGSIVELYCIKIYSEYIRPSIDEPQYPVRSTGTHFLDKYPVIRHDGD
jgi:hypothetical protein